MFGRRTEKKAAQALEARVASVGSPGAALSVERRSRYWQQEARRGPRRTSTLVLGPDDLRLLTTIRNRPERGFEYEVSFYEGDRRRARGCSHDETRVVEAIVAWLDGASIVEIRDAHPFVDAVLRLAEEGEAVLQEALVTAGSRLRPSLALDGQAAGQLWVYDDDRPVWLLPRDDGRLDCTLWLDTAQAAIVTLPGAYAAAELVIAWADAKASLQTIRETYDEAEVTRHAEVLERGDFGRWTWLNLRDKFTHALLLEPYIAFADAVLERPDLRRIPAFTSLDTLCFSRCTQYPFETRTMPALSIEDGNSPDVRLKVDDRGTHPPFVGTPLELAAYLDEDLRDLGPTWQGTAADGVIQPLNEALAAYGSSIRVQREREGRRTRVRVRAAGSVVEVDVRGDDSFCDLSVGERTHPAATAAEAARWLVDWAEDSARP